MIETEVEHKSTANLPREAHRVNFWRLVGYFVAMVVLFAFVISLLGRYALWSELACNFRLYILGALVVSAPVFFALNQRWLSLVWLISTVWCLQGTVSVYLPAWSSVAQPSSPEPATPLTIMSFNVLGTNQDYQGIVAEIREHDPEVLVVLEYSNRWPTVLERLHRDYPFRIEQPRWHGFGIAIFSKLPLIDSHVRQITRNRTDNPLAVVTVDWHGQPLRIAGTHLLSPRDKIRLDIRNEQMREIAGHLSQSAVETVLVGDFNCVPWSSYLVDLLETTGYRDSRQGFGYHGSWHAKKWLVSIPIDHAFVSPNVAVHDRFIGRAAGSDHFPLIIKVSVKD